MSVREVPASVGQRLLWMMDRYRATAEYGAFNCPVLCRIRGRLDAEALQSSVHALERRHEALRTTLVRRGRELYQQVNLPRAIPLAWRDVSDADDAQAIAEAQTARELRTRIDMAQWPSRSTAWRLGPTDHLLCLNLHHTVTDAWSTGVIFRDLQALYARRGDAGALAPVPLQYADFTQLQRDELDSGAFDRDRDYWTEELAGSRLACPPRVGAATETAGAADTDPSGPISTGTAATTLGPATADGLRELAKRQGTTLFAVLLAGYFAQLREACGRPDLTVASLFANRLDPRTHSTVGFLANMVMLRCRDSDAPWPQLLAHVHRTAVGALAHERYPFQLLPPRVVEADGLRADDVVFQMVTDPKPRGYAGGLRFELLVPESIGSRFSLELAVTPVASELRVVLFHRRDWFDDAWARTFVDGYARLLEEARRGDAASPAYTGAISSGTLA